jgi:CubicO group peptidase (beta-lactamase class C family)
MALLTGTLACLVSFATVAAAQAPAIAAAERFIQAELKRQRIPGLSVAILRGDRLVLARGYGYANLEHHVRATDSTVYQLGSVTKQFTAAAVVMLSEQGRLQLDDPITRYLPEGESVWRGVTIRHLLTHTSGIPEISDTLDWWRRDYTEDELVRLVASRPLGFVPGASWTYSSIGYALLGVIVHRVSGAPWGDFLRDRLFRPLGMRSARVSSDAAIVPNRAAGYEFVNDTLKNQWWASPTVKAMADLGLSMSVRDLVRWAVGLDQGKVLSRTALEASWTPVRLANGTSYPYGLGWHLSQQRGYRRIGHGGSWQGFWTTIQRYPDFGLTVVVLANLAQANPESIAFGIAGILEPALKPPHLFEVPLASATPPQPVDRLLADIVAGKDSAKLTPGLSAVTPKARRKRIGEWLEVINSWTSLGCDAVADRRISRLGAEVHQICYARGTAKGGGILFSILYDAGWRATGIDLYFL